MSVSVRARLALGLLAALALTAGCVRLRTVAPVLAPTTAPPPVPVVDSHITLPVEITGVDLRAVEASIPPVSGDSWYEDIPFLGSEQVNYLMWRDPITPRLTDSTLSMEFHPYFYLSVGDAYDPLVQCGFRHETAQERLIGITSAFQWDPKWSLKSTTTWRFLSIEPPPRPAPIPCKLGTGPWEYDAEARLNTLLTEKLNTLAADVDEKIRKKTDVSAQAASLWRAMNQTIDVTPDLHLQLHPRDVSAGPIHSTPSSTAGVYTLTSTVEIVGRPQLVFGPPPPASETPLPELGGAPAGREGFELYFDAELTFAQATELIASKFPITLRYGNHRVVICNPVLRPSGSQVILEVDLYSLVDEDTTPPSGVWGHVKRLFTAVRDAFQDLIWTSSAKIYFVGTPTIDVPRRDVWFPDLNFTVETRNVLIEGLGWAFRTLLLDQLRAVSRLNVGDQIDGAYVVLNMALNRRLGDARLTGYTNEVKPDEIFVTRDSLVARAHAAGNIFLTVPLKLSPQ